MNRIFLALGVSSVLAITGCGTTMESVMAKCDITTKYDTYSSCVKSKYLSEGASPKDHSVKAFFAHLDAITEAYQGNKISDAQAKAQTYDAYSKTIQLSNERTSEAIRRSMNSLSTQPIDIQSTMPRPINTNCTRIGSSISC